MTTAAKKASKKAKPFVTGKAKSTDIHKEMLDMAKKWDSGIYHAVILVGVMKEKDGSTDLHHVLVPGDLNRLEIMGAVSSLASLVFEQKI